MTNRRQFLFLGAGAFAARTASAFNVFTTGIANEEVLKIEQLEIPLGDSQDVRGGREL